MSTDFIDDLQTDDIIEAEHVNQFAPPVNNLESGATWYGVASLGGTTNDEYTATVNSGASPAYPVALTAGLMVHLKLPGAANSKAVATLSVNGSTAKPIKTGGSTDVRPGELPANAVVALLYDGTNFQLMGGKMSVGGNGSLNKLAIWDAFGGIFSDSLLHWDSSNHRLGLGVSTPAQVLEARSTSTQQRWSYDASNYAEISVGSTGNLSITGSGSAANGISIGAASSVGGSFCTVIGTNASSTGSENVVLGRLASMGNANSGVVIGNTAAGGAHNNVTVIGYAAAATGASAIALGRASSAAANEFVAGSAFSITNVYFGSGKLSATPSAYTINGSGGSGTNIAGGNLTLAGGKATGNAAGGSVKIQTSTAGGSGTTLQSLATVAEFGVAQIGFHGVTPVSRPAAYTQTYATADRTLSGYTPDVQSGAFTGAADGEAKLADLNALRVAYENLRAFVEDLAQHHNSVLDDLQAVGLLQ